MKYEIIILEEAKYFLVNLQTKLRAKAFRTIDLLQEFGSNLTEPHSKKVVGTKALFELRVKFSNSICRLFYFHHKERIYIITSGYVKKEDKLKKSEIDKALKLMETFF